jgi:hypothetical protein
MSQRTYYGASLSPSDQDEHLQSIADQKELATLIARAAGSAVQFAIIEQQAKRDAQDYHRRAEDEIQLIALQIRQLPFPPYMTQEDKYVSILRLMQEAGTILDPVCQRVIWRVLVPADEEFRSGSWQPLTTLVAAKGVFCMPQRGLRQHALDRANAAILALVHPPTACPSCYAKAGHRFPTGATTRICPGCQAELFVQSVALQHQRKV